MPHFVYALIDPRNEQVGYIGITENLYVRFKQHVSGKGNYPKNAWINDLKEAKIIPSIKIVETVDTAEEARKREFFWITFYTDSGVHLHNVTLNRFRRPMPVQVVDELAPGDELLGTGAVIEMLDVDLNYLYYLRRSEQLIPVQQDTQRPKPRLRYRRSDVKAFIDRREAEKESHSRRRIA